MLSARSRAVEGAWPGIRSTQFHQLGYSFTKPGHIVSTQFYQARYSFLYQAWVQLFCVCFYQAWAYRSIQFHQASLVNNYLTRHMQIHLVLPGMGLMQFHQARDYTQINLVPPGLGDPFSYQNDNIESVKSPIKKESVIQEVFTQVICISIPSSSWHKTTQAHSCLFVS